MKTQEIKTIDVNAKEWRDKINGNSYFSARATLNFGESSEVNITIPFQYGYDEQYKTEAFKAIQELCEWDSLAAAPLWRFCEENGIILRASKETCLKRECELYGKELVA